MSRGRGRGAHPAAYSAALAVLLAACTLDDAGVVVGDNPEVLIDTTGASFAWTCEGRGCQVGLLEETPLPPPCGIGRVSAYGHLMGRFMVVTGACVHRAGWEWLRVWERPITCATDSDCPDIYRSRRAYEYECRRGLCQNVDIVAHPIKEVSYDEAYALCLAAVDREDTIAPSAEASLEAALRVAESCDPTGARTCELPLPEGCLQP